MKDLEARDRTEVMHVRPLTEEEVRTQTLHGDFSNAETVKVTTYNWPKWVAISVNGAERDELIREMRQVGLARLARELDVSPANITLMVSKRRTRMHRATAERIRKAIATLQKRTGRL